MIVESLWPENTYLKNNNFAILVNELSKYMYRIDINVNLLISDVNIYQICDIRLRCISLLFLISKWGKLQPLSLDLGGGSFCYSCELEGLLGDHLYAITV